MKRIGLLRKIKPLIIMNDCLIASKNNLVMLLDDHFQKKILFKLDQSLVFSLLSRIPWIFRLLRSGVNAACRKGDDLYFTFRRELYEYSLKDGALNMRLAFSRGRGPLRFAVLESIDGFDDGVAFGEYFNNRQKNEVYIYGNAPSGAWTILYTFRAGEINHVHSLIPDKERKCVWILTGDFDNAASIWRARDNFRIVERVVSGMQKFRACVAFPVKEGLLYATDTPLTKNEVFLLEESKGKGWTPRHLYGLNGPCVYGCETPDYYVFSTATEPHPECPGSFFFRMFDRTPAPGIKNNQSDIIICRKDNLEFKLLYSKKKDFLPYRLFQFGAVLFPEGTAAKNWLYAYNVGNTGNDLGTDVYSIDG